METKQIDAQTNRHINAQPRLHQHASEIQPYGTVNHGLPLELEEPVRLEITEQLNQLLADTITLRDLYKKSHWQVAGATFYQLHLLFDKHYSEQSELVDSIATATPLGWLCEPETRLEFSSSHCGVSIQLESEAQPGSAAKAVFRLERFCPINSMAPALAIV